MITVISKSNKKAQVAIFIIIGLIIIIAIGIGAYVMNDKSVEDKEDKGAIEDKIAPPKTIKEFVERCIYETAFTGAGLIALQGGVIYSTGIIGEDGEMLNLSAIDVDAIVKYGYYENQNVLISIPEMEIELSSYISDALPLCINNFEAFPGEIVESAKIDGTDDTSEDITTIVEIVMDQLVVEVNYPISYRTTTIDKFIVDVPARLGYLHAIANAVIEKQKLDQDNVDFTFLSDLSQGYLGEEEGEQTDDTDLGWEVEEDVFVDYTAAITSPGLEVALSNIPNNYALAGKIDLISVKENNLVIVINDSNTVFMSAFKYLENKNPLLIIADEYKVMDGQPFVLFAEVEDDDPVHKFEDDTYLFDITNEGMISFTSEIPGEYDVKITVTDVHGLSDTKVVRFIVEEN